MEQLKYIIEDSTIAELLGVQNFTNKESAILELVKNAFDAQATKLEIIFNNNQLVVKDNGIGMNSNDIRLYWMHIGKSPKDYEIIDKNRMKRVLAGSKGIGRFALSRLGSEINLYSQKADYDAVLWATNWNQSSLEVIAPLEACGTTIVINGLRDKWNESNIEKLSKYLSRTYNNNLMEIFITFEKNTTIVKKYFSEPKLGYNCTSIIQLRFDSEKFNLECNVISDEFQIEAKEFCSDTNLYNYKSNVNCLRELENLKELFLSNDELEKALCELGDFSADFYFSLNEPALKDVEKFLYKHSILAERYESGVILYRNSFSISSYDGIKDWLGLGKRSRLSPAAATHSTGSWRVRENQLAGKVEIDKKTNYMLKDLSNRQGLDENIHYQIFVMILNKGLAEFERYRQAIIRKINKKNNIVEEDKKIIDKVLKNPNIVKRLSRDEVHKFITEIKDYKKENSEFKKEIQNTEERYKYDIRILNVLATSGLKATAIAHEMHNDRNSIAQNCDNIIDAMKKYEIWDYVSDSERTKYAYSNIPELLYKNKQINSKLVSFMDTMLAEVEKSNFIPKNHVIFELLREIKKVWERDYAWIQIELDLSASIEYYLPEDSLKVIFDNLILNSIQNNEDKNHLAICIRVNLSNGVLEFQYLDDGKGLAQRYIDNPMKILEVHETSRQQGHGLGMWIVHNTVVMSGGEVKAINGIGGFSIDFTLGDKFDG
ncbi:ATP-binding protein [Cohnella lubricantis]|uniref:ATP-binding protein n=1 Tax=Cohnella lubricantis TaxID=2163172 RepID=A0A841T3G8_9BACL|nr:ATP-binding protein [Cohnella lubricantis]MBB6675874.1 ATP-binding protein [Cohnella lubricantis]MBP2117210.1 signal transduction histidine kinase [Cohnella lubricantis]